MDFQEIYKKLSIINEDVLDFYTTTNDNFYHFFMDLPDLLNSLESGVIYSNKNARASQLDVFAFKDKDNKNYSYICTTLGAEGKERTTKKFKRPLGISFTNLEDLCKTRNYTFDPDKAYSQFGGKTQYSLSRKKRPTRYNSNKLINEFRDFRILAIGELCGGDNGCYDNVYFISGGQGRNLNNYWYSKLFVDKSLYNTLKSWFEANMQEEGTKHMYYHFKNEEGEDPANILGEPTYIYSKKEKNKTLNFAVNTSGNKNKFYKPWVDKDSKDKKNPTHNIAMNFKLDTNPKLTNVYLKEVIGIGPFLVRNNNGEFLLKMDMVTPGSKGGYAPPCIFGSNDETGAFEQENILTFGNAEDGSAPQNLVLNKETYEKICDLYNESEYRVYIPNKKDFYFKPRDIETIILPTQFIGLDVQLNLDILIRNLEDSTYILPKNNEQLTRKLIDEGIILSTKETKYKKKTIYDTLYKFIIKLAELLSGKYSHVDIELIGDLSVMSKTKTTNYAKNETDIDEQPKIQIETDDSGNMTQKFIGSNKTRFLVDCNITAPELNKSEIVKWNGIPSVIAPIEIMGIPQNTRVGAETIVIGKDGEGKKYVLFVSNVHKSDGFLELPGGGFYKQNDNYKDIALHRIKFKGGIDSSDISKHTDTNKALLLYEKGVAKDKGVVWQWSYYRLFTAYYNKIIGEDDIDYYFDNRGMATNMAIDGEKGYTCYLKWIPVDSLDYNRELLNRYTNIIPLIKTL